MKRAFIICGPPSSGNRLVGAILVRAGCWGEGSTNQPKTIAEIPLNVNNIIWIHPPNLEIAIKSLDFDITLIIVIREPEANCRSIVKSGYGFNLEESYNQRFHYINNAILIGMAHKCKIEIITYEGLSKPMLKLWLARLGLPNDNLDEPLNLVGQYAATEITNENWKHYGE